ncbi:MAG: hypothetical protein IPF45_05615 [Thermomonas sp.]|nr:hypothetical protein [Thermomonas sp.]
MNGWLTVSVSGRCFRRMPRPLSSRDDAGDRLQVDDGRTVDLLELAGSSRGSSSCSVRGSARLRR